MKSQLNSPSPYCAVSSSMAHLAGGSGFCCDPAQPHLSPAHRQEGLLTCHRKVTCYRTSCLQYLYSWQQQKQHTANKQWNNCIVLLFTYFAFAVYSPSLCVQSECIARPQGPGKQFTFQIKHHIQMKRILFMTGLSNIFKWISMYDIYCSDTPSGLVCGFLCLSIQIVTTCCFQEVYYVWNALYLCFVLRMSSLNQSKTTAAPPSLWKSKKWSGPIWLSSISMKIFHPREISESVGFHTVDARMQHKNIFQLTIAVISCPKEETTFLKPSDSNSGSAHREEFKTLVSWMWNSRGSDMSEPSAKCFMLIRLFHVFC